jgi:uncharacterized protein
VILHLVDDEAEASADDDYLPLAYARDGFVHCTADDELMVWVANRFYRGAANAPRVWTLDENRITSEVIWEAASPADERTEGILFPHVYGPINRTAIVTTRRLSRDADGVYTGFEAVDAGSSE